MKEFKFSCCEHRCGKEELIKNGCFLKFIVLTNGNIYERRKVLDKTCPDCGGQLLSCDCGIDYFTEEN